MKRPSSYNKLRNIWRGMKGRCYREACSGYKNYGKRGIIVCDEWLNNFESFESWALNNGYAEGLTIERIDNNGNYCPENCRWATRLEQANNKRNNVRVTHSGKTQTLSQWARELKKSVSTIKVSYYKGTFPPKDYAHHMRPNELIEYQGKALTISQWAKEFGVSYGTMYQRIYTGMFPPNEKNRPKRNRLVTYQGKTLTAKQWAKEFGVTHDTMCQKIYRGEFPPKDGVDFKIRLKNRLISYKGKSMTIKQWAKEFGVAYSVIKYRISKGIFPPKE